MNTAVDRIDLELEQATFGGEALGAVCPWCGERVWLYRVSQRVSRVAEADGESHRGYCLRPRAPAAESVSQRETPAARRRRRRAS